MEGYGPNKAGSAVHSFLDVGILVYEICASSQAHRPQDDHGPSSVRSFHDPPQNRYYVEQHGT